MSALAKKEEIVMISPTYGRITNPETLAAFAETEEILRQIKAGERVPMTYEEYKAQVKSWLEDDEDDV